MELIQADTWDEADERWAKTDGLIVEHRKIGEDITQLLPIEFSKQFFWIIFIVNALAVEIAVDLSPKVLGILAR